MGGRGGLDDVFELEMIEIRKSYFVVLGLINSFGLISRLVYLIKD